jgi:protein-disulfide isomerase
MNRFYLTLGGVALLGGSLLFMASRDKPAATPAAVPVAVASDGFTGFALGADTAPVQIVEYSDFECPYCARFANLQMPAIRRQLIETGLVRWTYREFPLDNHPYARYAAHAAQCAGEQGRFWELHDALFADHSWAQTGRNPRRLFNSMARRVGLDFDRYEACMDANRYAGRVAAARQEGEARGVGGTPTFFVNGRQFQGNPTSDAFKALVDSLTGR